MVQQIEALATSPDGLSLILEPTWRKRTDFCPLTSDLHLYWLTVGLHTKTSFLLCHMPTSDCRRRPKRGKQWKPSVFPFFPWCPLGKRESQCTSRKTAVSTVQIHDPKLLEEPHITFIIQDGSTSSFASIPSMLENLGISHVGMYLKSSLSGHRSW